MKLPLMIFAAGLGTRMQHLTQDRPKPLIKVGNRALLDHALAYANDGNFEPIVVNAHYKAEMIQEHLRGQSVRISLEDPLLETGGGLINALPLLGSTPIATLNSDAIFAGLESPLSVLLQHWNPRQMSGLLLLSEKAEALGHKGQGDFIADETGLLSRGAGDIFTGAQILDLQGFQDFPSGPFSINYIWDRLIEKGKLYGVRYSGRWCDVGQPSSIPLASELLNET